MNEVTNLYNKMCIILEKGIEDVEKFEDGNKSAGTRIRTMYAKGTDNSSNYYSPQMMVGTDDGQVLLWGYSNNNNLGHHATATWSSTGRSMMWNAGIGR